MVREWLQRERMRPEELAVKLKVSFATVQNILHGKRPYRPLITVLAQVMGVSEESLLAESKPKEGKKASIG